MAGVGCGGLGLRSLAHPSSPCSENHLQFHIKYNYKHFLLFFSCWWKIGVRRAPVSDELRCDKAGENIGEIPPSAWTIVVTYFIRSQQNKIDWIFALSNKKHIETGKAAKTRDKFDGGKLPRLKIYAEWNKKKLIGPAPPKPEPRDEVREIDFVLSLAGGVSNQPEIFHIPKHTHLHFLRLHIKHSLEMGKKWG